MRQSFTAAHHGNYHRSTDYCYTVVLTHSKFNLVQWQFIIRLTSIVHGDWLKLGLGMCSRAACQFQLSWWCWHVSTDWWSHGAKGSNKL